MVTRKLTKPWTGVLLQCNACKYVVHTYDAFMMPAGRRLGEVCISCGSGTLEAAESELELA